MTIKELRDNIDKIDDENLEGLLLDICFKSYEKGLLHDRYKFCAFNHKEEVLDNIDITDYMSIPYSVIEREN